MNRGAVALDAGGYGWAMAVDPDDLPPEAPRADAVEQQLPVTSDEEEVEEVPRVDPEVPEADAIEQAQTVPVEEEGYEAS